MQSLERDRLAEGVGWSMIRSPTPAIKRMLVVGIGVAVAQQAVGIDAIQYYLLDVLKDVLQEDEDGREDKASKQVIYILCILGLLKLFFVVIGSLLLDNRGRKKLLNVSLLGMCGACILISMSFIGETSSTFVILGLALYLISFSIGMGPVAWLIPSEIFPTSMRAKGMSIATFCNRIVATLMASTFLSTSNAIGWGAFFLLLAVVCVVVFVFVFFLLPETKGKSLEDMSLYFAEITGDNEILEAERRVLAGEGGLEMTTTPGEKLSAGELT